MESSIKLKSYEMTLKNLEERKMKEVNSTSKRISVSDLDSPSLKSNNFMIDNHKDQKFYSRN